MIIIKKWPLAAWLLMLIGASACAEDVTTPMIEVHGFGTVGAVQHREQGVQFRRDVSQAHGASAGQLSFAPDSMLGVQLTAHFRPELEATVQAISHLNVDDNYAPEITWAFLKYSPNADWYIRAGRLAVDFYVQGDAAEVGYSNLLIRQPIVTIPRSFNGLNIDWQRPVGEGMLKLRGMGGLTTGKAVGSSGDGGYDYAGSRVLSATLEYTRNAWMTRYTVGQLKARNEFGGTGYESLINALDQFAPKGAAVIDRLHFKDRVLDYQQVALTYDKGPLQALVSYDRLTSENWPTRQEFIASVGYRYSNVTPYAAFFRQHSDREIIETGIPYGLSSATDALNVGSALAQSSFLTNQTDLILGARYDFAPGKALKFQADRIRYQDPGTAIDPELFQQPYENRGYRSFTVFSVALDFLF